jgi:hypothetical protein
MMVKKSAKMWGVLIVDGEATELFGLKDKRPIVYATEELASKVADKLTRNSTIGAEFEVRPVTVTWEV